MVSFLKFVRYTTIVGAALLVILAGWISRGAKLALTEEFQKKTVTHVAGERGTCRGNPLGSAEKAAINGFPYKCGWNFVSSDPSKQLEVFAYTMPPGILGWSNAALVVDHSRGESVLIDVLMDSITTKEMLDSIANITNTAPIKYVLITHSDEDHIIGLSALPTDIPITSGKETIVDIQEKIDTNLLGTVKQVALLGTLLAGMTDVLKRIPYVGEGYIHPMVVATMDSIPLLGSTLGRISRFGLHSFHGFRVHNTTKLILPQTSIDQLDFKLLDGRIQVKSFSGHSREDLAIFVRDAGVVVCADLLFSGIAPLAKVSAEGVLKAVEELLEEDEGTLFVPGHGPIMNRAGVEKVRDYWLWLRSYAKSCFDEKLSFDACVDRLKRTDDIAEHTDIHSMVNLRVELDMLNGKECDGRHVYFLDEVGKRLKSSVPIF